MSISRVSEYLPRIVTTTIGLFATLAAVPPRDTTPSFWATWHPDQALVAQIALLVAIASLATLFTGTIFNLRDRWRKPAYGYAVAFWWTLVTVLLVYLTLAFL